MSAKAICLYLLALSALVLPNGTASAQIAPPPEHSKDYNPVIIALLKRVDYYDKKREYASSVKLLLSAASLGSGRAAFCLSVCYAQGQGVPKSKSKSLEWLQKGVDLGDPNAMWALALDYLDGIDGMTRNQSKAISLLKQASDLGSPDAMYELGQIYRFGASGIAVDEAHALDMYQKAADLGNKEAMVVLGHVYYEALLGRSKDLAQSKLWLAKAANLGYFPAMNDLGVEEFKEKDYLNGLGWLKKGSDLGDQLCTLHMAEALEVGSEGDRRVRPDIIRFYKKAIKLGSAEAQTRLDQFLAKSPN